MQISLRLGVALKAASVHLLLSTLVALLTASIVFGLWYPYPYSELAGGRELFFLIICVDLICGPLLTAIMFNPVKPRSELWRDLGLVILIQVAGLGYGLWVVWEARPLFLVQEVDRFKVIAMPDLAGASIAELPAALQPRWWAGPKTLAIRDPKDIEEKNKVMFEAVQGGRDYAERPEFYLSYEGEAAMKSLQRAKPLSIFLQKQPSQQEEARKLALEKGADMAQWLYLPVVGRQDWIAVLDKQGQIQGFLRGDGF